MGARFDQWNNVDARRIVGTAITELPDRRSRSFSPRASLLFRLAPSFSVTSSAYRAFRAPTLNELYRTFQVGDVVTLANERLVAESVEGVEAGFLAGGGSLSLRATAFRMHLGDTVANVTLSSQPGLITRQRQNLGSVRSQGVEVDAEARAGRVVFSVGWLRSDAGSARSPPTPRWWGCRSPSRRSTRPRPSLRYVGATGRTIGIQGRWAGSQFDDDRNAFPLGTMRTVDAFLALPAGPGPWRSLPPARTSSAAGTRSAGPPCSRWGRPGPCDSASGSGWPRAARPPRIEPHRLRWYKPLTDQDFGRQER